MHWEEKEVAHTTLRLPAFGTICILVCIWENHHRGVGYAIVDV